MTTRKKLYEPALEVTWPSCQQDIVGMPVQAEDRRADWLLDVLAHPPKSDNRQRQWDLHITFVAHKQEVIRWAEASPVIFLLKVTDGDEARATANGELVLPGRPLNAAGGTVDPKDDQGGFPNSLL